MELKVYYSALHACYATGYSKEEAAKVMAEGGPLPKDVEPVNPDVPALELTFEDLEEFAERGRLGWKEAFQMVLDEDTSFTVDGLVRVTPERFLELEGITKPGVVFWD